MKANIVDVRDRYVTVRLTSKQKRGSHNTEYMNTESSNDIADFTLASVLRNKFDDKNMRYANLLLAIVAQAIEDRDTKFLKSKYCEKICNKLSLNVSDIMRDLPKVLEKHDAKERKQKFSQTAGQIWG